MFKKSVKEESFFDARTAARSFIAGGLGATSFMIAFFSKNEMVALFMGIFLAFSLLIMLDVVMPFHRRFHPVSGLIFLVLGIISAIIMSPALALYLVIMITAACASYRKAIKRMASGHKGESKSYEKDDDPLADL